MIRRRVMRRPKVEEANTEEEENEAECGRW